MSISVEGNQVHVNASPEEWTGPSLLNTKLKNSGPPGEEAPCGARLEAGGEVVRLRGLPSVKTGEELLSGENALVLPEALWPKYEQKKLIGLKQNAITKEVVVWEVVVTNEGEVKLSQPVTEGETIPLDDITYPLN